MKTGIIDVGGGLRGIYAAGIFDWLMDRAIRFDLGIGISAGSANIAAYIAGQRGRNYRFYTEYAFRKEYMSPGNFFSDRSYIDLDYVYGTLSAEGGEDPFDYDSFMAGDTEMLVVACEAETGRIHYFDKSDFGRNNLDVLKASSAIPLVCRPYVVGGVAYFDGALGDTIPVDKALEMGCDKVVLILTKPRDTVRKRGKDAYIARMIQRRWPRAAARTRQRADRYNRGVKRAKELEQEGRVLILAPDDTCGVDTLTRDRQALEKLYQKGYADASAIGDFLA